MTQQKLSAVEADLAAARADVEKWKAQAEAVPPPPPAPAPAPVVPDLSGDVEAAKAELEAVKGELEAEKTKSAKDTAGAKTKEYEARCTGK